MSLIIGGLLFFCECSYGTGFYVGDTSLLSGALKVFGKTSYNPLCFLQFEDIAVPPTEWDNVRIQISFWSMQQ